VTEERQGLPQARRTISVLISMLDRQELPRWLDLSLAGEPDGKVAQTRGALYHVERMLYEEE
jgi:hypothetical protein